jgi:ACS family hexuronate transporter-like MFS transporter
MSTSMPISDRSRVATKRPATAPTDGERDTFYKRQWRWFVLATLFLATFLNYFDRQMLGAAMPPIAQEFGFDEAQRGRLLAAFVFTYAAFQPVVGFVADRIHNIRWFFSFMVCGWSVSTMLMAAADDYHTILWLRRLLGVWEAANFPICIMIIARLFPAGERSLASGIFGSGAFIATLAAPKSVIFLANHYNWRVSFLFAGALGLLWLVPWLAIFRHPERRALNWNRSLAGSGPIRLQNEWANLKEIFGSPGFWGVTLMGMGLVPILYFATQWLPSYFELALDQRYDQALGDKLTIIYLMLDIGLWLGGAAVLWMSRRGIDLLASRRLVIVLGCFCVMSLALVPSVNSLLVTVVLLCLALLGIGAFLANQHAFKQDVALNQVASVSAWVGCIETTFAAVVVQRVGTMVKGTNEFSTVFYMLFGMAIFALLVAVSFIRPKWYRAE